MKPRKILHLINNFGPGGLEIWLLNMLRTVPRSEWQMDVCCKARDVGPLAGEARACGAEIFQCRLGLNVFGFTRRLERLLRTHRYDLLQVHLNVNSGPGVWVGRRLGMPVLASFHAAVFGPSGRLVALPVVRHLRSVYGRFSVGYAIKHADLVTGCSQSVADALAGRVRSPGDRFRPLHLGTAAPPSLRPEERAELRQSLGLTGPAILHVGRFTREKNHAGMVDIFQRVLLAVPGARMVFVGTGILREKIEQHVRDCGLEGKVLFLGARKDVPRLMQACDCLLFPSLHEGFGMVLIEASAAGLPIVASRVGGMVETVEDGRSAHLHDVSDHEGMARSVARFLTDAAHAAAFREAGRARHAALFSLEAAAARLTAVYEEVLAHRS